MQGGVSTASTSLTYLDYTGYLYVMIQTIQTDLEANVTGSCPVEVLVMDAVPTKSVKTIGKAYQTLFEVIQKENTDTTNIYKNATSD